MDQWQQPETEAVWKVPCQEEYDHADWTRLEHPSCGETVLDEGGNGCVRINHIYCRAGKKVRSGWIEKKQGRRTTLPGLRFERRQVEVSVVQQLKQRLRMPSVSFVFASEVWTMETGGCWMGA